MIHENYIKDFSEYKGVNFHCEKSVHIEKGVIIKDGAEIWPNVTLIGNTIIGKNSIIYNGAFIKDTKIGNNVIIGQYTLLREHTIIKNDVIIGPHSEISRSIFENKSGAYHKCVILDAHIMSNAKLGAGVVTANTNHDKIFCKIVVGSHAKIGINVSLVAPITIGKYAIIGAGSTITKNIKPRTKVVSWVKLKQLEWIKNDW